MQQLPARIVPGSLDPSGAKPSFAGLDGAEVEAFQRLDRAGLVRLGSFVALYLAAAVGATVLSSVEGAWAWVARLPLYLLAAAALHGISLFTHEGVHGCLSRSPLWNRLLAAVCAWPVLQNFAAYRVLHLRHHADLGGPLDPDHYPNYARWPRLVMAMHWGRLVAGYPVYVTAIPFLALPYAKTFRERAWILGETAAVVSIAAALFQLPSLRPYLLHGWLLPMVFINTMVNVRGMSQHTLLLPPRDPVLGTRSILTSRLVAFFMCNENLHLEHHLYPRVPWYRLPALHARLGPELRAAGAPFIPSYTSFVVGFVRAFFTGEAHQTLQARSGP